MRPMRLCLFALAATLAALCLPGRLVACNWRLFTQPTLLAEYDRAGLVLLGRITAVKAGVAPNKGTSEFVIEMPFKKHPVIAGKERLTLPLDAVDAGKRYLIFFDIEGGKLTPFRGIEAPPGSELAAYFRAALSLRERSLTQRVRHFFDYLSNPAVAYDAFQELFTLPYKDLRVAAKTLPAAEIVRRLGDPKTPRIHYGLYALLLAECGTAKDADALARLAGDPDERQLVGYLLLRPSEGWAHLRALIGGEKVPWGVRLYCLRALRFLHEERPHVIPRADLVDAVVAAMQPPDMTDLAIEQLRRWKCLGLCDRVLPLFGKSGYDVPIIRRSILRYALCASGSRAEAFVQEQRRLDPDLVKDMEELLALEAASP